MQQGWEVSSGTSSTCTHTHTHTHTHTFTCSAGDESFIPQEASEDEEETIEKEEKEAGELDYSEEIAALERESMLPIEELLAGLPQEMLEEDAKVSQEKAVDVEDEDFRMEEAGQWAGLGMVCECVLPTALETGDAHTKHVLSEGFLKPS